MRIQAINNKPAFTGNITMSKNIFLMEKYELEKNSRPLLEYAKNQSLDYMIFRNDGQKGLSVLAENAEKLKKGVFEVFGYPSGDRIVDVRLILNTMKIATENLKDKSSSLGWSCE